MRTPSRRTLKLNPARDYGRVYGVTHNKQAAWLQKIKGKESERIRRRIGNWKAPGYWLKNFRALHQRMAEQLQHCINNHQTPEWMTTGRTALIQKDKSKGNVASNYRPITCLPIMGKLLTGIISERLYNYLEETDTIPKQQKSCRRKCKGTKDQLLIDKMVMMNSMTSPLHESRLLWIHDPYPNQPPRVTPRQTVVKENHDPVPRNNQPTVPRNKQQTVPRNNQQTVPRNNQQTVPRNNNTINRSDARARAPLDIILSASWFNSNLPPSSIPAPRSSVCNPVPRATLQRNNETTQVCDAEISSSLPPKRKRDRKHRRERRAKERE